MMWSKADEETDPGTKAARERRQSSAPASPNMVSPGSNAANYSASVSRDLDLPQYFYPPEESSGDSSFSHSRNIPTQRRRWLSARFWSTPPIALDTVVTQVESRSSALRRWMILTLLVLFPILAVWVAPTFVRGAEPSTTSMSSALVAPIRDATPRVTPVRSSLPESSLVKSEPLVKTEEEQVSARRVPITAAKVDPDGRTEAVKPSAVVISHRGAVPERGAVSEPGAFSAEATEDPATTTPSQSVRSKERSRRHTIY